ncbi:DUF5723 family protein [Pedobacter sp. Leaf250]|uniref:DUF5723 family protein n=1 Tax=Pedobacter sp. Leaf250 TaxID=2876559 RepID=UPI0012268493|nr:DUF5723 family protein [Pedobacter sp. Leaf250]RZL68793.1 MAG: hypothetical protein EOO93_03365 [Pedobacter sp.]
MKKLLLALLVIASFKIANAQQYALFGTKTMFDAFENTSQKSFTLDSSRKFSSNFFLPYFGINAANTGEASNVIRKLTQTGYLDTEGLPILNGDVNHFYQNSNIYVATFRLFHSYKYQKEIGLAWQIRSDAQIDYTNETLAIFDSPNRFPSNTLLPDVFNSSGYQQSYHQFSLTYRENYNKRLAFGVKASLLSGILYNKIDIADSYFYSNPESNTIELGLAANYRSNFTEGRELRKKTLLPFKNPGLSMSFGTNYTSKKGLMLMANIKDLGFIWWRKNTQETIVNTSNITINTFANRNDINNDITNIFTGEQENKKFLAPTNAKADIYVSKVYGFYKPSLIVSKNLFYKGGDVAFVNSFNYKNLSGSVTPLYNFNNIFMVGLQGKYQTPNFEIFLGTDNLISTAYTTKGIISNNGSTGSSTNGIGASVYMGIGIKFGNVVNHPQFSDIMPGINDNEGGSFFKNLFSIFKKK